MLPSWVAIEKSMKTADSTNDKLATLQAVTQAQRDKKPSRELLARSFGHRLQGERVKQGFTLRQLAEAIRVPNSHISAMETGHRRCGSKAARKIADAFWPEPYVGRDDPESEKARADFLYHAASTIKARGVIQDSELYPPQIFDAVGSLLRRNGIKDRDVLSATLGPVTTDCGHVELRIVLCDERLFEVSISMKERGR